MVKITTFHDRPVRHVQFMPDGRARHLRVSLGNWLVGRGVYLVESHVSRRAQARGLSRRCG